MAVSNSSILPPTSTTTVPTNTNFSGQMIVQDPNTGVTYSDLSRQSGWDATGTGFGNAATIADLTSGSSTSAANKVVPWTLEGDPVYQAAMASGSSQFNYGRANALADLQNTQTAKATERKNLDVSATDARRRLAGNYASRGMAGGAAGALTMAEAQANALQIAARTSIQDQLAALNQAYLANYGAVGTDWTGTLVGQQYKTQAAQAALTAQLAKYGTV